MHQLATEGRTDGRGVYKTCIFRRVLQYIKLHQTGQAMTESTTKQKLTTISKSNTISILGISVTYSRHNRKCYICAFYDGIFTISWAPSSEIVSSSIALWQILTAHAQPLRRVRDLAFCLEVPLDSLLVWASSEGSGETVRMRMLAWTFAARIGDKYQIRLSRPN